MQRLSYISTPLCRPYKYCSVVDRVRENASLRPEQEILIHRRPNGERFSITNEMLEKKSTTLANYLNGIGITRRQYVGIVGPNTLEWVIGELGILKTGAVSVHLSMGTSDAQDAMDIIKNINCRFILMDPGVDMTMLKPLQTLQRRITERNRTNPEQEIQTILLRVCQGFEPLPCLNSILKIDIGNIALPPLYPESPAVVFCTSGSTGQPKLVQTTHFSLVNASAVIYEVGEMYYCDRPFVWAAGTPLLNLATGSPRLFIDSTAGFKDDDSLQFILDCVREENCSHAMFVPYQLSGICDYVERTMSDDFRLKTIITGGELIGEICNRALRTVCSNVVKIAYGSTETLFISIKPIRTSTSVEHGNVGECVPGVEIKIIEENGDTTTWGSHGEICIRSHYLSQGYLNAPKWNEDLFTSDGWMRTGDIGKVNEEGDVIIVGKRKNVISRGTRKLIPEMIEEVIRKIPGLKGVFVIPVPDKRLLEEVCVCYVPDSEDGLEPDEMKALCNDLFLVDEAVDGMGDAPTYFLKLIDIPVLNTGKADKQKLKEIAVSKLNISF